MRKISITLAVVGVLAPLGANALGIGDIHLHSSLNQSLSAEIPLVTSGAESISDVKVSLASPEAFSKAGLERHYALSQLRFTPMQKPDGSYVIKVSSSNIVREPFLNFLVEVNWPQGRMLREFTVLLDPPSTFQEESVPNVAFPETARRESSVAPAAQRETAHPRRLSGSGRGPAGAVAASERASGASYGPVQANETLWGIARRISEDVGASQEQIMAALYQANPQAFIRNNINQLKAGVTLAIPASESIQRLMVRGAAAKTGQLGEQRADQTQGPVVEEPIQGGQLKLLAPSDSGEKRPDAVGRGKEEEGKSKGDIALEVADTVKQENEEIRARLSELEQQLSSMRQLLVLKDEQIATLRGQDTHAEQPVQPPVLPVETPSQDTAEQLQPAPVASAVAVAAIVPQATTAPSQVPPSAVASPVAKPVQPVPQPTEEPGLLAELLDEPLLLALTGITAALLLGIVAWLTVRRRAVLMDEAESILTPGMHERIQETPTPAPILGGVPTEHIVVAAKSSFLSEFTPSDFDALGGETDEVDPISEADVYLAYGRYKQAEELIRGAIEQYPERDECKLKLLEIHYATENRAAFESYASELLTEGKDADQDFWEKVVEMGRELCPGNALFASARDVEPNEETTYLDDDVFSGSVEEEDIEDDFIAELKRFDESRREPAAKQDARLAHFDSHAVAKTPAVLSAKGEEEDSFSALDFDFALSPAEDENSSSTTAEQDESPGLDNLINFEPGLKAAAPEQRTTKPGRDKTLDDILADLGAGSASGGQPQRQEVDTNVFEFTTVREQPGSNVAGKAAAPAPQAVSRGDDEDGDIYASLTDMDAQETKLDLAKAYIDMGDDSTARGIIEDVLAKGNDAQKSEASLLLSKIDKAAG